MLTNESIKEEIGEVSLNKRIAMVDFWSVTDQNGKPIGHGVKVGNEYYSMIKESLDVVQYVNKCLRQYLDNKNAIAFTHSLRSGVGKCRRIISNFRCLYEVYRKETNIWFYVPDIYLFLFILIIPKKGRHLAVNIYEEYITNKIKNWIFTNALKKIDVVFVTNQLLQKDIPQGILIPDYPFDESIYADYICDVKQNRAVCIGTMNKKKQLAEAVEAFVKNGYPLYIVGQFDDYEMFNQLNQIKSNNITIENRYVEAEEYYELLASSKFCLIPYDPIFYKNRTSGVLQECLFMKTVPVAPNSILNFSSVEGVGYEDISQLSGMDLGAIDTGRYVSNYSLEIQSKYTYVAMRRKIVEGLQKM